MRISDWSSDVCSSDLGEEERTIRAAINFRNAGLGTPVLIGREDTVREMMARMGVATEADGEGGLEIHNARLSRDNRRYTALLYGRLQRRGFLQRDCQRMVNQDRHVFAPCMVAAGEADASVPGLPSSLAVQPATP